MMTATFRNPRLVALALLVILSAGVSSFLTLGRQEDPTITNLQAVITTLFPGADPAHIEALVTEKLETELAEVPEIDTISSTSSTGVSVVQVELVETIDPDAIEDVWADVRARIVDAQRAFPAGVIAPELNSDSFGAFATIIALTPSGDTVGQAVMRRHAEDLADVLRAVPGTKNVELFGAPQEEVLVSLDPARTAILGLTADDVSRMVRTADAKVQSGRVSGDDTDFLLSLNGEIHAIDRIRQVVLRQQDGTRIARLGDIAEVSRSIRTPQGEMALSGGEPAVLVAARLEDGLQIDGWMQMVQGDLDEWSADLPTSLTADVIFDQSLYTADRLSEVGKNMAIGVALVVAVLLLTLGVRAALIVALVLPLVSLATIASLKMIGLPLHQMSVTGLIVALGLLVDAAIVMTDEIRQRLARGVAREAAVRDAVSRLSLPLLASTITTALSFTPMILLPGPAGDFVGAIAVAVVLMLGWSLLIALTITPAVAGWVLPRGQAAKGATNGLPSGWLGRGFHASLRWSLRHPVKSIALALILPVTGFIGLGGLTAQFFPGVDRDQFHIEVELPAGTGIQRTRDVVERIDEDLRSHPDITQVAWTIGRSAPAFYYNMTGDRKNAPDFAQALVTTASPVHTANMLTRVQAQLNESYPEARILVRGLVQGPPVNAPVEMRLVGPDVATLATLGADVRQVLLSLPSVTIVRSTLEGGAPKMALDVDEVAANIAGLTLTDVARQLQAGLEGVTGGSLLEGTEELPVRVRMGDGLRGDMSRIANFPLIPPGAEQLIAAGRMPVVPLSAIATPRLEPAEPEITRRNGERVNTLQAFVQPGVLPEEALQEAREALDASGFALAQGYKLQIGGDSDARGDVVSNLLAPLGLIVTLSIATVVLTFNSFRLSAVTFVVAILSAGLSFLALAVFNYPFGITAIIGVIGSIGVSINAALILLSGLQANTAARHGNTDAMSDVVMGSSRHILSTTVTTFGGFLPLILAGGGFWPPFAMAVAGGVLLSSVVSFYFTPQMFALVYARAPRTTKHNVHPLSTAAPIGIAAE